MRLPISAAEVVLRAPCGYDELLLAEARAFGVELAVELLERVCTNADGSPAGWRALPYGDVEHALLRLRADSLGDRVRGAARCPQPACGEAVDLAFSITDYLDYHRPSAPRALTDAGEGWFRAEPGGARFRVPLARDVEAARDSTDPRRALAARCVEGEADARTLRRVERALARIAPLCSGVLTGTCPACGRTVEVWFDALGFALHELRTQATEIFDDLDAIARAYHWSEPAILALPQPRRAAYASYARGGRYVA